MVIQALLTVLVILVIANFAIGIYNQVDPPCMNANEYFQGATKLPDGAVSGLGSIPTHTDRDYVGAARVATGIPGTIGFKSHNQKNGYIGDTTDKTDNYVNPVISAMKENDASDCRDNQVSEEASNAIDALLRPGKLSKANTESITSISEKKSSLSEFEVSMEGIATKQTDKTSLKGRNMSVIHQTARDGYTSRPSDRDVDL